MLYQLKSQGVDIVRRVQKAYLCLTDIQLH